MADVRELRSIFSHIHCKRYDLALRSLKTSLCISKAESMSHQRHCIAEFKVKAFEHLKSMTDKSLGEKLQILEFFQSAFRITDDIESEYAMRYEILLLEELMCEQNNLSEKWASYAKECFQAGFASISIMSYEKAIGHLKGREVDGSSLEALQNARNEIQTFCYDNVKVEALKRRKDKVMEPKQVSESAPLDATTKYNLGTVKRNFQRLMQSHKHQHDIS